MQGVGHSPPPEGTRGLVEAARSQKMNNNSLEEQNDRNKSQEHVERDFYPASLASTEETTSAIQKQVSFNVEQNTPRDWEGRNISTSNT